MIASERKPTAEILQQLASHASIFVVACDGCSAGCQVSDPPHTDQTVAELTAAGKAITGVARVEMVCNAGLTALMLTHHLAAVNQADALLVLSCGVGVQAVAAAVQKPVHPAANSIYLGGFQGLWRSDPRCAECGECVLSYTGGICPYTACSKGLLYGSCGGPKDGKCEVDASVPCGWMRIYERLAELGQTDLLKAIPPLRNYRGMMPIGEKRRSSLWALEWLEPDTPEAETTPG